MLKIWIRGHAVSLLMVMAFVSIFGGSGLRADTASAAPGIAGDWSGSLKVGATSLRIMFHIAVSESGYSATMDSPDQGAKGIPVASVKFDGKNLDLNVAPIGGSYSGTLDASGTSLKGAWKQSGMSFELDLVKSVSQGQAAASPPAANQSKPVPANYSAHDVAFDNAGAGVRLAGTLTTPAGPGPFPAVVLVTGSGPQNRDEEILGHKPFLVIANYLAERGIASLRYDDRGVGSSTGNFQTATTLDFADDAQAAVDFLSTQARINPKQLGVIGHSEGGIVASILGARSETRAGDPKLAFLVLLAAPGVPGNQLLLMQNSALGRALGMSEAQITIANEINSELYSIALSQGNQADLRERIFDVLSRSMSGSVEFSKDQKDAQKIQFSVVADELLSPWMRTFLSLDPAEYLKKIAIPVLALDGTRDLQVPAEENLAAIKIALESMDKNSVTTVAFEGLNHLFQHATTGLPAEYAQIQEDFAPEVLNEMGDWILKTTAP